MCDLAHAVLFEQFEQDGRAVIASGGSDHPPQWYRDALHEVLTAEQDPTDPTGAPVAPDVLELRKALGVG